MVADDIADDIIERVKALTPEERLALEAAQPLTRDPAWLSPGTASYFRAWQAACSGLSGAPALRAWEKVVTLPISWDAATDAAATAAVAVVARGRIDGIFTREHYNTLSRAWRTVVGPIHPDDPTPAEMGWTS